MDFQVVIIGAGLAGSECAYQLAKRGIAVGLIEMRPHKMTPAHTTGDPAELVCSNSFRSNDIHNAVGLIKDEMRCLDALTMRAANLARVPAGSALAVDRAVFSRAVGEGLASLEKIRRVNGEVIGITRDGDVTVVRLSDGQCLSCQAVVIATGPLTAEPLSKWIASHMGGQHLYFYDAIAPIVAADSINMSLAFKASRYGKGDDAAGDYLNCPFTGEQYEIFINSVRGAELTEVHDFDKAQFFEGCLPIEVMAARGLDVLRYGPMKPVGLTDPRHPEARPHAVVQLRQDNLHASLYNMVGFQTRMKWGEQKRVFRLIPGLENAEFVRLGAMHRNTYLCSPRVLDAGMELKSFAHVHFAGQMTGCEGYVESAAVGLSVGLFLAERLQKRRDLLPPPPTTALGALLRHILKADPDRFQPMNINFGLFEDLPSHVRKSDKKQKLVARAQNDFHQWICNNSIDLTNQ